jgi:hypothetical protein
MKNIALALRAWQPRYQDSVSTARTRDFSFLHSFQICPPIKSVAEVIFPSVKLSEREADYLLPSSTPEVQNT